VAKILICEDDDLYRQIAQVAFADGAHELLFAHDGDEALAVLAKDKVDLVVTDLVMPGKDGLEVIRAVRAAHGRMPIIAMTAGLTTLKGPLMVAATALGADEVVEKPFRPTVLRERADGLLAKAAAGRGESAA
jgi:two-component system response regulator VicR